MNASKNTPHRHLTDERLAALAGGAPFESEEARALLGDAESRRRLAEKDASALFGALGALPLEVPVPTRPRFAERTPRAAKRVARAVLAVAAASLAAFGLLGVFVGGTPEGATLIAADAEFNQVVTRVDSGTAQVFELGATGEGAPTVTLIIDDGAEWDL